MSATGTSSSAAVHVYKSLWVPVIPLWKIKKIKQKTHKRASDTSLYFISKTAAILHFLAFSTTKNVILHFTVRSLLLSPELFTGCLSKDVVSISYYQLTLFVIPSSLILLANSLPPPPPQHTCSKITSADRLMCCVWAHVRMCLCVPTCIYMWVKHIPFSFLWFQMLAVFCFRCFNVYVVHMWILYSAPSSIFMFGVRVL